MSITVPLDGFGGAGGGTGGTLTVNAPVGVTVTVSKDGKTKTKTANALGVAVFKGMESGTWSVTITDGTQTAAKTVNIVTDYDAVMSFSTIPNISYDGEYEIVDDNDNPIATSQGNWKIRLLTSGTLRFIDLNGAENGIDVFCVGGGGGGKAWNSAYTGPGGGGGYTKTQKAVTVEVGTSYEVVIGAGGAGGTANYQNPAITGGATTAFGVTADGGEGRGGGSDASTVGGSGGSGGAALTNNLPLYGGTDGGDGGANSGAYKGGKGQGTTTREFGDKNGRLYASGGNCLVNTSGDNGADNTGNGGDGAGSGTGGSGGSGIVVIRNARG